MKRIETIFGVAVVALGLGLVACEPREGEEPEAVATADTVPPEQAIEDLRERYIQAYNDRDVDALVMLHSEDFQQITPEDVLDRESIRANMADTVMVPPDAQIDITTDEMVVAESGDVAFGSGTSTFRATGPDGTPISEESRWLAGFRKVDGEWKLHRLVVVPPGTSAAPAAGATTPRAPADTVETM